MIFCENCGKQSTDDAKFCEGCGTAIVSNVAPACANCRKELEAEQKFCDGCGAAVDGDMYPVQQPIQQASVYMQTPAPVQVPTPVAINTTTIMAKHFSCSSCGTSLDVPKNPRGVVRCPACNNECVLDGLVKNAEIAAKENITGGIPLTAKPAKLHQQLVYILYESPNVPLDVFDKIEIVREERYCVPAYQFNSSGTMKYSYMTGHPVEKQKQEKRSGEWYLVTYTEIDWLRANDTAELDAELFVSGNKRFTSQIESLYMCFDPGQCEDIEYLNFPSNVETYDFDIPDNKAYSDYVKPHIVWQLEKRVRENIENIEYYKDMTITGTIVRKDDLKRVFLGLYRIVFVYENKEYSIWTTGDGQETLYDELPTDTQRQYEQERLQNVIAEKEQAKSMIYKDNWGSFLLLGVFIFCGAIFLLIVTQEVDAIIVGAIIGCIIYYITRYIKRSKREPEYNAQLANAEKEVYSARRDLDVFEIHLTAAKQRFKEQKKALRGIYEKVSGNAEAF